MSIKIVIGDAREKLQDLADQSVNCCVTSPPYFGLRDYGCAGQMGLEPTPEEFVAELVAVFREVRRVLRDDGTLWLNLGDSYARDARKGQHKPGDAGKQNYIIERGGGRAASGVSKLGSSDGAVRRADRPGSRALCDDLKPKDLLGIPWMVAFALRADGWYLRSDIIWHKPNPMPESVLDRPTRAHEYIFLLTKSERYFYDNDAVREPYSDASLGRYDSPMMSTNARLQGHQPGKKNIKENIAMQPNPLGRNRRDVWLVPSEPFSEAHFATFPPALIKPCILAGCPVGGAVLDPFGGAGTTGMVADRLQRSAILIEINPEYAAMARRRIDGDAPLLAEAAE